MVKQTNICYWDSLLKDPPQSYRELFAAERSYFQKHLRSGSKVLEVGCGVGRSIDDILLKTKNVYGVDNDSFAVVSARKRFLDIPEVSIMLEDGRALPFRGGLFDYVACMTTPANFGGDRDKFFGEMKRVLKFDGELIMSVFNEDAFEDRMGTYLSSGCEIKEIRGTTVVFDESFGANVSEQFSCKELEDIFDKEGLVSKEIVRAGIGYICRLGKARS